MCQHRNQFPRIAGDYVHYIIRFENTGTANAENVVVTDVIDTSKFDLSSLVPLDGSDLFTTRIVNGNRVEFIFSNIDLPFDDANNDGHVAFKIKTLATLIEGDSFSNDANIYFDYNLPITTNDFVSTLQTLGTGTNAFEQMAVYPNPVADKIFFPGDVQRAEVYDMPGRVALSVAVHHGEADLSALTKGVYVVKLYSQGQWRKVKIVKE